MYYIDSETIGFHGPMALFQYALDSGPITLHEVMFEEAMDTVMLIDEIANHPGGVCGFNLVYDWFHVTKIRTMLEELITLVGPTAKPVHYIPEFAAVEAKARDGYCVKPVTALDLMLFARKGPYQITMDRKPICLRRVPRILAEDLVTELNSRIEIPSILFARNKKVVANPWKIVDLRDARTGVIDTNFVDVRLKFAPSSGLKAIVVDAGLRPASRLKFAEVQPTVKPMEVGWCPVASLLSSAAENWFYKYKNKSGYLWPFLLEDHAIHWKHSARAREYAEADVEDLRLLREFFGHPEPGDDDSVLACMVGATRWRGFAIDFKALKELEDEEIRISKRAPKAPQQAFRWLQEKMDDGQEKSLVDRKGKRSTKRTVLETVSQWTKTCTCCKRQKKRVESEKTDFGFGDGEVVRYTYENVPEVTCLLCKGTGKTIHPAAERAALVLAARRAVTKQALFTKLRIAGRLHPAASVVGSLSGRMSGRTEVGEGERSSSINALGIQHDKRTRKCFTLALPGFILNGGDFDAYEVSIADAAYGDEELRHQLLTCDTCGHISTLDEYQDAVCVKCGGIDTRRKIHGLFAMELKPGMSYAEILATKGSIEDWYDKGKRGIFSQFYGGDENTLVDRIGISLEAAVQASRGFKKRYKGVGRVYEQTYDKYCSMRQPGGIGTKVIWHDPVDYVESLTGFRRSFKLEHKIAYALFGLSEAPPEKWQELKMKCVRRDRPQTILNATRSALLSAAFQVQAACMRAALNHLIQSTGATVTKKLQRQLWELQPTGTNPWRLQLMNVHDEILAPAVPELTGPIRQVVSRFVTQERSLIPLLKIVWKSGMSTWAEK